ncbi:MAG: DUF4245 domain-containing protein [Actinomycetota bacterium]|nr:DUF4245 domain-containing protein [Actinomycetota bacterium]MDQ2955813.1 DUF4245 domain-containing protein [Actinomycetota bacterium]
MTRPLTSSQRQRLRTPANLWRALIPLLAIIVLITYLTWPRADRADGVHVIDTAAPIAAAQQQAGFTVAAPSGLSDRWRPTSTEFIPAGASSGASFRIGYVTPAGQYAEFLEGDDSPDAVAAQYGPLSTDGNVPVEGTNWSQYRTSSGHRLLRHTAGKVTTIVTGTATQPELVELAGSLH